MIALARADARRFRAAARRGCPNGRPKGPAPPVRVTAEGGTLTLTAHLGEVVVALRAAAPRPGDGSLTVLLDALGAVEAAAGVATLEAGPRGAVTARWGETSRGSTAGPSCGSAARRCGRPTGTGSAGPSRGRTRATPRGCSPSWPG
jgi:hypothetical protein